MNFKYNIKDIKVATSFQKVYPKLKDCEDPHDALKFIEKTGYHYLFSIDQEMNYYKPFEISTFDKINFNKDSKYEIEIIIKEVLK